MPFFGRGGGKRPPPYRTRVKTEDEWCETNVAINVVMVSEVSSVNVACNHNFPRMVVSSATGCKNDPLNYVPMLES